MSHTYQCKRPETDLAASSFNLDLVDMRLLTGIAETKSVTRGAERTFMSVPAASIRIKQLEASLGVKLMNRSSNGVSLTPPGEAIVQHSREVLQQLNRMRGDLQGYVRGVKGRVSILATTTSITETLPSALARFLATHPDVNIDLRERVSVDIVRAVFAGSADVGIVAGNVSTEGLEIMPYKREKLVLSVSHRHVLAAQDSIDFAATVDFDYVGMPEESTMHLFLMHAAQKLNRPLNIRIQVGSFEALARMIEENVGVGIIPESTARRLEKSAAIKNIPLNDDWAVRDQKICVKHMPTLPSYAQKLIHFLVAEPLAGDRALAH